MYVKTKPAGSQVMKGQKYHNITCFFITQKHGYEVQTMTSWVRSTFVSNSCHESTSCLTLLNQVIWAFLLISFVQFSLFVPFADRYGIICYVVKLILSPVVFGNMLFFHLELMMARFKNHMGLNWFCIFSFWNILQEYRTFRTKDFSHKSFSTSFGTFAQFLVVISHDNYKWETSI